MNPNQPNNKPSPEQMAAFAKAMSEEHTMVFTKAELTAIFNVLVNVSAKYGDFIVIDPIVKKIQPIVAVDSNIPSAPQGDSGIVGAKGEVN